jgi:hypothetical protein
MGEIGPPPIFIGKQTAPALRCQVQLCKSQQIIYRPNREPTRTMDDWIRLVRNHAADKSATELNPSEKKEGFDWWLQSLPYRL